MADRRDEYIRTLFTLSKSDPAAWDNFKVAFADYTAYELERALKVPVSESQMALGMSRRIIDIRDDIYNIQMLRTKIS